MRIRIVRTPPIESVDGIRLDGFALGSAYDVGITLAALFFAEGWAEPMAADSSVPVIRRGECDPFVSERDHDPNCPRNLIRERTPPCFDPEADFRVRPRRRT